jgi:hypothetical protein
MARLVTSCSIAHAESRIELAERGRPWAFDGDGALFLLVSEAKRIRLAHLFDPVLAVHTSGGLPEPMTLRTTATSSAYAAVDASTAPKAMPISRPMLPLRAISPEEPAFQIEPENTRRSDVLRLEEEGRIQTTTRIICRPTRKAISCC